MFNTGKYNIEDLLGNKLAVGFTSKTAAIAEAKRLANKLRKAVYVYADWSADTAVEVEPSS